MRAESFRPVLAAVEAVSPAAFSDWISAQRDSDACLELSELAGDIDRKALRAFTVHVSGSSWAALCSEGLKVEAFLAMAMALLAREEMAADAAALFLTALRCNGATTHGAFHPLSFFEYPPPSRSSSTTTAPPRPAAPPPPARPLPHLHPPRPTPALAPRPA